MQCLVCGSESFNIEATKRGVSADRREAICKECNQRYKTETRIIALYDASDVVAVDNATELIKAKTEKYIKGIEKMIDRRKKRAEQNELW